MNSSNNFNSSTNKIESTLTINDITTRGGQTEWLKTHPEYSFYILAKEKNSFGIQALFQEIFSNPFNEKNHKVIENAYNALITLAKEDTGRYQSDEDSFNLLKFHCYIFLSPEKIAYVVGLVRSKKGWKWNIDVMTKLLNEISETNNPNLNEHLNTTAKAGIQGFFEGHHDDLLEEGDFKYLLEITKENHSLLFQKTSEKIQELNIYINNKDSILEEKEQHGQSETLIQSAENRIR